MVGKKGDLNSEFRKTSQNSKIYEIARRKDSFFLLPKDWEESVSELCVNLNCHRPVYGTPKFTAIYYN